MAGNSRDSGRSVTARALSVLTAFAPDRPRLTLTEIAREAAIPLATAHRLVGELEVWGALCREADGRYSVGLRLWEIGRLAPVHTGLRRAAVPSMRDLSETTGQHAYLAVRDGLEAVCVEKVAGRRPAPSPSRDDRLPLHTTGVGKVLLAHAPAAVLHVYCERTLSRHTPHTVVDPGSLGRELHGVRQHGFARASEEMTLGSCSVAVPVRDGGVVVAALGLVVHGVRAHLPEPVDPLLPAAEAIRRRLAALDVPPGAVR